MTTLFLKKNHERRLRSGHLWIFSNELENVPRTIPAGEIVEVKSSSGASFGTGFFNPNSLIAVRLLLFQDFVLSQKFFADRIRQSLALRNRTLPQETAYRLVFGESDFLPGLVIDRYGDFFALQTLSAGMEIHSAEICSALREIFPETKGIIEKNISKLRELEGLPPREGILWGEVPQEIFMRENGIEYVISLLEGQKTGYFLDQKINRREISVLSQNLRVLDCFTNQGGFALNAAKAGAKRVLGVDSSQSAIDSCRKNTKLGEFSNVEFLTADVFDFLKNEVNSKNSWDLIVLDPPAFAKSKKHIPTAKRGYADINRMALKLITTGGFLATGSCSHHIYEDVFLEIIEEEARKQNRRLRLIFRGQQSPCHPILTAMPETRYLKFFIFQVE